MRLSDLETYDEITIQMHDNPDADALASGFGLYSYFHSKKKKVKLVYCGRNRIHKSNLKMMMEELNIPAKYLRLDEDETEEVEGLLITVDCQYGAGNVTGLHAKHVAIIDHHQPEEEGKSFLGIINPKLGSCSTLVWKLLKDEGYDIHAKKNLATALYYGLYMDTNQFAELSNPVDMDMREDLPYDKNLITLFRNSNISLDELQKAGIALLRYSYNDDYLFGVIKAEPCDPNILGIISDFLLQVDVVRTCVVYNQTASGYKFSVRSCTPEVNAAELAEFLASGIGSGGGHFEKAGGFISMARYEAMYPTLHSEAYFNNRMTTYFDSFDLIYADEYKPDFSKMTLYRRKRIPLGYVKASEVLPAETPITIRTLDGDMEMLVTEDLYLVIGNKGRVHPFSEKRFLQDYEPVEGGAEVLKLPENEEYTPILKNRANGYDMPLLQYAKQCIASPNIEVYAASLKKGAKLFRSGGNGGYMTGWLGDYVTIRKDSPKDIRIVERKAFLEGFEKVTSP